MKVKATAVVTVMMILMGTNRRKTTTNALSTAMVVEMTTKTVVAQATELCPAYQICASHPT